MNNSLIGTSSICDAAKTSLSVAMRTFSENPLYFYNMSIHEDNQYFYTTNGSDLIGYDNIFYFYKRNASGATTNSYVIPEGVTTINDWAFYICQLKSITLPTTITKIKGHALFAIHYLKSVIFTSTTPPTTLESSWLAISSAAPTGYDYKIYVPDSAVATYKSKMSSYASGIYAVSELN